MGRLDLIYVAISALAVLAGLLWYLIFGRYDNGND